jgi:integrase
MGVASIERRLSGLAWSFTQRGFVIDRANPHVAEVLAGIRREHARAPLTKDAVLSDDLLAMLGTLEHDLRGLRDRAILLVGFAGALRRSEIVGLDCGRGDTEKGTGWVEIQGQDRLARGRDRPRLQSYDLSRVGA